MKNYCLCIHWNGFITYQDTVMLVSWFCPISVLRQKQLSTDYDRNIKTAPRGFVHNSVSCLPILMQIDKEKLLCFLQRWRFAIKIVSAWMCTEASVSGNPNILVKHIGLFNTRSSTQGRCDFALVYCTSCNASHCAVDSKTISIIDNKEIAKITALSASQVNGHLWPKANNCSTRL